LYTDNAKSFMHSTIKRFRKFREQRDNWKGGEGVTVEIATLFTGVAVIVGACIAGGIIYAGLQKIAEAINKQK